MVAATAGFAVEDMYLKAAVRHMPHGQRPGRNVGEVFRPTPTADLEGRHRRQQWQGGFGSAGNLLGYPLRLRLGHDAHAELAPH